MRRGDLVTVALAGDYGKPRPALILQSNAFVDHPSVTIALLTSDLRDAPLLRIKIAPSEGTGLSKPSQIMIDKIMTVPRAKIGQRMGEVGNDTLAAVCKAIAGFLEIA